MKQQFLKAIVLDSANLADLFLSAQPMNGVNLSQKEKTTR